VQWEVISFKASPTVFYAAKEKSVLPSAHPAPIFVDRISKICSKARLRRAYARSFERSCDLNVAAQTTTILRLTFDQAGLAGKVPEVDIFLFCGTPRYAGMTRLVFRANAGDSAVFLALRAKAFCTHFYCDLERLLHVRRRLLPLIQSSPSLIPYVGRKRRDDIQNLKAQSKATE
jgi:hypothetical protein